MDIVELQFRLVRKLDLVVYCGEILIKIVNCFGNWVHIQSVHLCSLSEQRSLMIGTNVYKTSPFPILKTGHTDISIIKNTSHLNLTYDRFRLD